jgi:hypothetical protein
MRSFENLYSARMTNIGDRIGNYIRGIAPSPPNP